MKKTSGIEENDTPNLERRLESKEPDAFQFNGLVNGIRTIYLHRKYKSVHHQQYCMQSHSRIGQKFTL